MPTTNVYFTQGTTSEQYLIEDLIIESLQIYGKEFFYIPRTIIAKDEILGEDRLSKFTSLFPIEMYFENIDGFEGQGAFLQKFGLMMEQSATLVVARRRWEQLVGRFNKTSLPKRPCEGDLIYFPLTKGLFEIKFVQHQNPFYQIGQLYVYKLQVELFQYSSENISTGMNEIDQFESLKTFSTEVTDSYYHGSIKSVTITDGGSGYTSAPDVTFGGDGTGATGISTINSSGEVTGVTIGNAGTNYQTCTVAFSGGGGVGATGVVNLETDIDKVESYGDNTKFVVDESDILFSETNPFGDVE